MPAIRFSLVSIVAVVALSTVPLRDSRVAAQTPLPTRVSLAAQQTQLQNQGNRGTCITFAAVAALEAAYRRAGYGALDLSEEFLNHMGKMGWLGPHWADLAPRGAGWRETQVAAYGGGGGVFYIEQLAQSLAVPPDSLMPYRLAGFSREVGGRDHLDPYWNTQRAVSGFNLDARILSPRAVQAPRYYTVNEYTKIYSRRHADDRTYVAEFEAALAAGHEIVWDFDINGDQSGAIWRYSASARSTGGHAMLIIGYDRTSPDSRQHYFIVKNSWGPTGNPGGYTHIAYDYLKYGESAAYIRSVKRPAPWPELAFIGRWMLSFDGHRGILDIYHLPGVMQLVFDREAGGVRDRRLGTFYDASGRAYRVNGSVRGNTIEFLIDMSRPNLRWDETPATARRFRYALFLRDVDNDERRVMAGYHTDPDGRIWSGYAHKLSYVAALSDIARPVTPASYLGRWALETTQLNGVVELTRVDGNRLTGVFTPSGGGARENVQAVVNATDRSRIAIATTRPLFEVEGRVLSHERGVIAGYAGRPRLPGFTGGAHFGFYALYLGR